jgi:hypothetical protein
MDNMERAIATVGQEFHPIVTIGGFPVCIRTVCDKPIVVNIILLVSPKAAEGQGLALTVPCSHSATSVFYWL